MAVADEGVRILNDKNTPPDIRHMLEITREFGRLSVVDARSADEILGFEGKRPCQCPRCGRNHPAMEFTMPAGVSGDVSQEWLAGFHAGLELANALSNGVAFDPLHFASEQAGARYVGVMIREKLK